MNRVRNVDDFRNKFRSAKAKYELMFSPSIAKVREKFEQQGTIPPASINESLEAHVRVYLVNALLEALNWRLDKSPDDGLPNLIPEAPVRSVGSKTIRFLDYLGIERDLERPLLIVETKRPSARLPRIANRPAQPSYAEVISHGLSAAPPFNGKSVLTDSWDQWLSDLGDYVRTTAERTRMVPRRAVITNGGWLVIFLDPSDAFLEAGKRDASLIIVFEEDSPQDIESRATEIFRYLEHQRVLGTTTEFEPGETFFAMRKSDIDGVMHGLRVWYNEDPIGYTAVPAIKIAPVLFLHSCFGAWFRIERRTKDYTLPHSSSHLPGHLMEIEHAALALLNDITSMIGRRLTMTSLKSYYDQDGESFGLLPGVQQHRVMSKGTKQEEYVVVTGEKTHYLMPNPTVSDCPYHDWAKSQAQGKNCNPAIHSRTLDPRSFFFSSERHHCSHRDVVLGKSAQLGADNRGLCGNRSGSDGQAFCEIYRFETHLCCRTCAFEEVCTKADQLFILPCKRSVLT